MLETSLSNITLHYYNSNKKIYSKNSFCYNISNVGHFNAEKFAEWMQESFKESSYKTFTELAEAVKSNKATISRLMNGASQTLTDKPSQPKPDLVIRLAEVFGADVNQILVLAGHAPQNGTQEIPEAVRKAFAREGKLTPNDEILIANFIEMLKKQKQEGE